LGRQGAGPKGPRLEVLRAESGDVVLVEGRQPHPHQLGVLGECCKLPQWGPKAEPGHHQRVFSHFKHPG